MLKYKQFEQVFDGKRTYMSFINSGCLERMSTGSVKNFYFKNVIFEIMSKKNNMTFVEVKPPQPLTQKG